ncbi:MAG TPA: hypothetical protein VIJ86_04350 [Acidimicrobiales bacterium]
MNKIRTKVAGRVAVVAALSLGFTVGAVGVASASSVGHRGQDWTQSQSWVKGIVSSYTAGSSISITSEGSTTPVTYTLTSATTIAGLATGATLVTGDKVSLVLSTTTPVTVTSITVKTPEMQWIKGVVSAYTAGSSISITSEGSTTPVTYTLTSATTIAGLATGATLVTGDKVSLVLSTSAPTTVTSINVEMPESMRIEAVVSAYTVGTSISVTTRGSTTPVTYTLTSSITITGLATGATLAAGDNVDLVLSSTTPTTVTSIFVEASGEGTSGGHGDGSSRHHGDHHGFRHHGGDHQGFQGFGSSKHDHGRR